jgi:hypothetical protein
VEDDGASKQDAEAPPVEPTATVAATKPRPTATGKPTATSPPPVTATATATPTAKPTGTDYGF